MNENERNANTKSTPESCPTSDPACPVCGGRLIEHRDKAMAIRRTFDSW